MCSIKRLLLLLILFSSISLVAQEELVPRRIALVPEGDHPQTLLLLRNLEAELIGLESIDLVEDPEASDAVIYLGRLEFGSRSSLWVRGVDRYFDAEVFTETYIFQEFDLQELVAAYVPLVRERIIAGFAPLDAAAAGLVDELEKGDIVLEDPFAEVGAPVELTILLPPGARLRLRYEAFTADEAGRVRILALPGTLISYRADAVGYLPRRAELLAGDEDATIPIELTMNAKWALDLKLRLFEMGFIPGAVYFLAEEDLYLYASVEQNMLSLKNIFTWWEDDDPGFLQPVVGIGSFLAPADFLFRPFLGMGVTSRIVLGETQGPYLSKTFTYGIDFNLGFEFDPLPREDMSIIVNYTPRWFYSSFFDAPFDTYYALENPPVHIRGHYFFQWAGPVNIGLRWAL